MKRALWTVALLLVAGIAAAGILVYSVDELRWRTEIVASKAAGDIDDISWSELLRWLKPGSGVYLEPLTENPNPFAAVSNVYTRESDRAAGGEIYSVRCANCHGESGEGESAPSLRNPKQAVSDWATFRIVQHGIPEKSMPPSGLSDVDAWKVVAFVRAFTNDYAIVSASMPETRPVAAHRLVDAENDPAQWLLPNGGYSSNRYSTLDAISSANVHQLGLAWARQLDTINMIEATPLVNDGVMYVTEPSNSVVALDAETGAELWRYQHRLAPNIAYAFGVVNRGVAMLDDAVFVATLDAKVVALDARTGRARWTKQTADPSTGHNYTSAPLAVGGKIIVGIAGGDHGARGFITALDAETGDELWKFDTIPARGAPGNETWGPGDAWTRGGAAPWGIGSFDPDLGLVYWGIGNPSPDFNGDERPGDNLYSNCVVALDVETGAVEWYFQFTPHDTHDWDATQVPVLTDAVWQGRERKLMLWANRNAFYYVLDRETGEFLHASEFSKQTWSDGIDAAGRPIVRDDAEPTAQGTLAWPNATGATNWWPPAYSPDTGLVYVPAMEFPSVYFKGVEDFEPGVIYLGTDVRAQSGDYYPRKPSIAALDALSGEIRFTREFPSRGHWGQTGGVLATAGGVIFLGDFETFYALDAAGGAELWTVQLGGGINAAPVTYAVDGRQFVALAAGNSIFAFSLPAAAPSP